MCSQASRNAHKGRVGGGRGNLRENREDPAPTVGRLRGYHCDPHRAQRPPIGASMRVPCHPAFPHEPVVFTTTRHAASLRSSNNCKCLIETFFIARGESPLHKGLNPYGPFSAFPLLEYRGLKPILPFLEGRSDATCRVVIRPSPTYGNLWFLSRRGAPHCYLPPRRFPLMPMGRK